MIWSLIPKEAVQFPPISVCYAASQPYPCQVYVNEVYVAFSRLLRYRLFLEAAQSATSENNSSVSARNAMDAHLSLLEYTDCHLDDMQT